MCAYACTTLLLSDYMPLSVFCFASSASTLRAEQLLLARTLLQAEILIKIIFYDTKVGTKLNDSTVDIRNQIKILLSYSNNRL